jgi:hypothetical protein
MCIVHNIEKIAGFLKRKGKDVNEVLRKGILGCHIENIGEIVANCADKKSFLSGNGDVIGSFNSN